MSIHERRDQLVTKLKSIPDKDDRLRYIIEQGRQLDEIPAQLKIESFLVKGCISRAWLIPSQQEGKLRFLADSEAAVVKGIIAMLLQVYNDSEPDEILALAPDFLAEVGVTEHLSLNRRNGLSNVVKMIYHYAEAFQKQEQVPTR